MTDEVVFLSGSDGYKQSEDPTFVEVGQDGFIIANGAANGGIKPQYGAVRIFTDVEMLDGVKVTGIRVALYAVRPAQTGQKAIFIHNPDTGVDVEETYPPIPRNTGTGFFLDPTSAGQLMDAITAALGELSPS